MGRGGLYLSQLAPGFHVNVVWKTDGEDMAKREKGKPIGKPTHKPQAVDSAGNGTKDCGNGLSEEGHPIFPEWKLLSLEQINHLLDRSVDEVQLQLDDVLNFRHRQTCVKEAALSDYFVSGFWWAKEMNFTCRQVSGFMALSQLLLDNIREKQMPLVDNFSEFAKEIARTRQPPSSQDSRPLFDVDQAISITDYFKSSLFQHYRLYEYLFTQPREELLFSVEELIEVVNSADFIAPLEEGMPVDVFSRYMTQTPVDEAKEVPTEPPETPEVRPLEAEAQEKIPADWCAVDASQAVLGQLTPDRIENLQEDVSHKPQVPKESSSARKRRSKKNSAK
ncbi:hypothetical protein GJAV_G00148850 [Gymnothorax javanicus]|nr:hypothetical protein GJAV_G00148850 [Gymnothorax javanicus]